jgi:hypothetical protein
MSLVNINIIHVLSDEELSYLWCIFGLASVIAVKKPCPVDGVAAVAVHDMETVHLVICPSARNCQIEYESYMTRAMILILNSIWRC